MVAALLGLLGWLAELTFMIVFVTIFYAVGQWVWAKLSNATMRVLSPTQNAEPEGQRVLRYNSQKQAEFFWMGIAGMAFSIFAFVVLTAIQLQPHNPECNETPIGVTLYVVVAFGVYGFFAAMFWGCLWAFFASLRYRIDISESGITQYGPLRLTPRTILWEEIASVTRIESENWGNYYLVRGTTGETIKVELELEGVFGFQEECRKRLPEAVYPRAPEYAPYAPLPDEFKPRANRRPGSVAERMAKAAKKRRSKAK